MASLALRFLRVGQHLREPVMRERAEVGPRHRVVTARLALTFGRLRLERREHAIQRPRVVGVIGVLDTAFDVGPVRGRALRQRKRSGAGQCQRSRDRNEIRRITIRASPDVMGMRAARMPGSIPAMNVSTRP